MELEAKKVRQEYLRERGDANVFCAVEETDLRIPAGKITCLSGPSGSGKTTLLSMLSGILKPTEGKVFFGDTDLYSMSDAELSRFRNAHFGIVPQGQTALQTLNVFENVLLPYTLYHKGKDTEKASERAAALLKETGIDDLAEVMPSELSGGELRRMAIARALVTEPDVILADEPTADLDEENTKIALGILRRAADAGKAVLIVTHDRAVIDFADTVYEMSKGILSLKEDKE